MKYIPTITLAAIWSFTFICYSSSAQTEKTAFSLKEAQEYAIKNNATVKNALLDKEKAKKKIWETTAIGLPQISAKGSYSYLPEIPEMNFGGYNFFWIPDGQTVTGADLKQSFTSSPVKLGVKNNFTVDFSLSQLIFSGSYIVGLQASRTFSDMSDKLYEKSVSDIRENIANSYFLVLVAQENRNILDSTLANMRKVYSDMKVMLDQGFIENTDVDQLELTVMNMENALSSLSRQLIIAERLLKFQMGIDLDKPIVLTDNISTIIDEGKIATMLADTFNLKSNVSFQLAETQMKLQKLNLKLEKSTFLPTIAAFYNHQEKVNKPDFDFSFPDMIGATVNVPIFGSGQKIARVQQAKLELDKSKNTLDMVSDGLILEILQAKTNLLTADQTYNKEKMAMELAEKIYKKTYLKYKEGMASSLDLTTIHTQYLTSQSNYYTAVLSLVNAKNKLEKLTNNQ